MLKHIGFPIADCGGLAIFEGPSYGKVSERFQDEEYQQMVVPDEEKALGEQ